MSVRNPPSSIQQGSHPAVNDRLMIRGMLQQHGACSAGDLVVSPNSPVGNSVLVSAGGAFVLGSAIANQGTYHVFNDAPIVITIANPDPSFSRKDLIVARIQDADASGGTNLASVEVVAGTPSSSPILPTPPASTQTIAVITVPNSATYTTNGGIITANIVNIAIPAVFSGAMLPVASQAIRDVLAKYDGRPIYRQDTDQIQVWDGTTWDTFEPNNRLGALVTCTGDSWSTDNATVNFAGAGGAWTIRENVGGYATAGGTTTPITIPAGQDGVYAITLAGIVNAAATGLSRGWIQLGGILPITGTNTTYRTNASTGESFWSVSANIPLQATDTIGAAVAWINGGAKTSSCTLSAYLVSR